MVCNRPGYATNRHAGHCSENTVYQTQDSDIFCTFISRCIVVPAGKILVPLLVAVGVVIGDKFVIAAAVGP